MGRQLFLHHYLPAHLASALIAGALIEFIFNVEPATSSGASASVSDAFNRSSSASLTVDGGSGGVGKRKGAVVAERRRPIRERIGGQSLLMSWAAAGVLLAVVAYGFVFFAPLTYGKPGLSVDQVLARKWLGYDLHFAK